MAAFADGRFFLSVNPTLRTERVNGGGPAQPQLLQFEARLPLNAYATSLPTWDGLPKFTEHSYRTLAADGNNGELILFQNIDYAHAEWAFRDRHGSWSAQGKLRWPWGAEYDKPQPIRVCYPTVALRDRAVYFCGVSDILEPYQTWRDFKKQITGREWDYDFRRLFFTWSPDIRTGRFLGWVEIASRDKTAGWIFPGDLWAAPDGLVHIVWTERALDERLREKFYPGALQSHALNYAQVRDGQIVCRRTLLESREGGLQEIPSAPRFQVTPDDRLILFYCVQGADGNGKSLAENRVLEIFAEGTIGPAARVPLASPFTSAFTATIRAGSPRSSTLELLGQQAGHNQTIRYARVRLW